MASVVNKGNAEHYRWAAVCDGWHLLRRAELSVIEERAPAGAEEVRHFHSRARQLFYVLEGTLEIEAGEVGHTLQCADALEVAPGVPHQVRNPGPGAARFLVVSAPHSHGDRTAAPRPAETSS